MPQFVATSIIPAPVDAVFAFHERPDALALLSPPFPPVRILHRTPGLTPGASVTLRVGLLTWVAVHTAYIPNRLFVDEQMKGPFARWIHRHEFEDVNGATRLTDRIEFELPGGGLINGLFAWTVRLALRRMFAFRHAATARAVQTAIAGA